MKKYETQELLQKWLSKLCIENEQDFFEEASYDLDVKDKIVNLAINLAFTNWSIDEDHVDKELETMLETII